MKSTENIKRDKVRNQKREGHMINSQKARKKEKGKKCGVKERSDRLIG